VSPTVTSLTSILGYSLKDYINTPGLANLASYNAGLNLAYTINSARDLFMGYNFGSNKPRATAASTITRFNVGVEGKILPKLNGTVSIAMNWKFRTDQPTTALAQ